VFRGETIDSDTDSDTDRDTDPDGDLKNVNVGHTPYPYPMTPPPCHEPITEYTNVFAPYWGTIPAGGVSRESVMCLHVGFSGGFVDEPRFSVLSWIHLGKQL